MLKFHRAASSGQNDSWDLCVTVCSLPLVCFSVASCFNLARVLHLLLCSVAWIIWSPKGKYEWNKIQGWDPSGQTEQHKQSSLTMCEFLWDKFHWALQTKLFKQANKKMGNFQFFQTQVQIHILSCFGVHNQGTMRCRCFYPRTHPALPFLLLPPYLAATKSCWWHW